MTENAGVIDGGASGPSAHVSQNIDAIAALVDRTERSIGAHQKAVERTAAVIGRPWVVVLVTGFITMWLAANLNARALHIRAFDPPPFSLLQTIVSISALYTTLVVVGTQNRQGKVLEQRDHLQLQAILLTEQKVTKIIGLLEELRRDLPNVTNRTDTEADALQEALDPNAVVSALEVSLDASDQT